MGRHHTLHFCFASSCLSEVVFLIHLFLASHSHSFQCRTWLGLFLHCPQLKMPPHHRHPLHKNVMLCLILMVKLIGTLMDPAGATRQRSFPALL
uniref:Putative secreted protein n=1 Tax=Rhipicephalus microplus TaxID=6941 RepID=A0A6M2DCR8_RHIMP